MHARHDSSMSQVAPRPPTAAPAGTRAWKPARHRFRTLGKVLIVCLMITGCQPDMAGDGGSTEMFGFFKRKAEALPSTVSPELQATLKRETAFPQGSKSAARSGCTEARVDGEPPAAHFVSPDFTGITYSAFRIAGQPGLTPLGIVNMGDERPRPQFWELASDTHPSFVRQIPVQLDPAQKSWIAASVVDAGCLPGPLVALGLAYSTSLSFQSIVVYDRQTHGVRKISDAVYDGLSGAPDHLLATLDAGPDRALLLYFTDQLRLRAEVYVRKHDHIMVFSPRHPQGLEILTLGLDDGNVVDWTLMGKTLWLHTFDQRKDRQPDNYWSLDLSSVL